MDDVTPVIVALSGSFSMIIASWITTHGTRAKALTKANEQNQELRDYIYRLRRHFLNGGNTETMPDLPDDN